VKLRRLVTPVIAGSAVLGCLAASASGAYADAASASAPRHHPAATRAAPLGTQTFGKGTASVLGVVTDSTFGEFDTAAHVQVNLQARYLNWGTALPVQFLTGLQSAGVVPLIELEPRSVTLRSIADGRNLGYLETFAAAAKSMGGSLYVAFAPEMNGTWYSWGNQPALYIRAWRRVVSVFRTAQASNVSFVWIAHHVTASKERQLRRYWPGSGWVNWVGLDGYYEFSPETFKSIFGPSITAMRKITKDPMLITETAVGELGKSVPAKIANLFSSIKTYRLLGLIWFDIKQHGSPIKQNWNLESRPVALKAFRAAAKRVFPKLAT
jgi:mannan endo-1,4-beta-mannosidase